MAKARMLHRKVSISVDVNKLPLPARLLFTWMIPHADDRGRLKGDPGYIKAMVVPFTNWSSNSIQRYLNSMHDLGLIHYWQLNNDWFVEFVKWDDYQTIRSDRSTPSVLPSFNEGSDNQMSDLGQPDANPNPTEDKIIENNLIETNKSEESLESIAVNSSSKRSIETNPFTFVPVTEGQVAALEAWKKIEPDKTNSFNFYLWALKQGLTADKFYEFAAEIDQDPSVKNKGATFNHKVQVYLKETKS